MGTKLILAEGLPGSGKSTIAQITDEILNEIGIEHKLFCEGNLEHPADFDRVSCMNHQKYNELTNKHEKYLELIKMNTVQKGDNFFISYAKLMNELGDNYPDELLNTIMEYDIYELSLDRHIDLILDRWTKFVDNVLQDNCTYIFECCFIQNPITVSMLRDNSPKELTISYIKKLKKIIQPLNPILLYVNQNNIDVAFRKVAMERSNSWLEGFVDYYTNRGFGKENKMNGIEGTIEILKSRKALEMEILEVLDMEKIIIDNSFYDYDKTTKEICNIINKKFNKK